MEIHWEDLSHRRGRYLTTSELIDVSASHALSILLTKVCGEMLDGPNAQNFNAILLRLDFFRAAIELRIGCLQGFFDGCSIQVKELDEIEANHQFAEDQFDNNPDVEFDYNPHEVNCLARSRINMELGIELLQMVKDARDILNAKCKSTGFRFIVFEVGERETVIDEHFEKIGQELVDQSNPRDDGSGPANACVDSPSDGTTGSLGGRRAKFPWSRLDDDGTAHHYMCKDYNYDAENSIRRIPYDRLAEFEPDFRFVEFDPLEELVDLLECSPGFIISSRFLEILRNHSLPPHAVYPLPVRLRKREVQGYFFIHFPYTNGKMLDELTIPQAENLLRDREDIINLDLISIGRSSRFSYCFVSQALRESIESAKLKGIRFGTSRLFRRPIDLE